MRQEQGKRSSESTACLPAHVVPHYCRGTSFARLATQSARGDDDCACSLYVAQAKRCRWTHRDNSWRPRYHSHACVQSNSRQLSFARSSYRGVIGIILWQLEGPLEGANSTIHRANNIRCSTSPRLERGLPCCLGEGSMAHLITPSCDGIGFRYILSTSCLWVQHAYH